MNYMFSQMRTEYHTQPLVLEEFSPDPLVVFRQWFEVAAQVEPFEANAMTLATADTQGRVSARIVLLKELDDRGFTFYTNYESHKGQDLQANPQAALVFHWARQHRQIRIEGPVEKVDASLSDAYFATRPRGAQLGAWVSRQSQACSSRGELEEARQQLDARWEGQDVQRPPHWGGYRLVPQVVEFWQGRPDRLHDRVEFRRQGDGWERRLLMP